MRHAEEIRRIYIKSDEEMLQQAQVMHDNFVNDQIAFVAKLPELATPFETLWQSEIDAAQAIAPDSTVVDYLQILTHNAQQELYNAQDLFQVLMFYAKRAYPKELEIQNSFGADKYKKSRNSQLKMIDLMEQAHTAAIEPDNTAALIAKGYTQVQINNLLIIRDSLYEKNSLQENAKNNRLMSTYDRITALNNVWGRMVLVSDASKLVFKDNYTKIRQYLLYPEGEPGPVTDEILLTTDQSTLKQLDFTVQGTINESMALDMGDETVKKTKFSGQLQAINHNYAATGTYNIKGWGVLNALSQFQAIDCNLTSVTLPDVLTNLNTLNFFRNKLTSISIPDTLTGLNIISLADNDLDEASVNGVLITVDGFGTTPPPAGGQISLHQGNNAPPTGDGLIAMNNLISRGWTVIVNPAPIP